MKKITLILIVLFTQFAFSQVGVNTTTPDPSSMLDISATNKGVLVPRVSLTNVTTTMLDGTNTAATGLLIWNTNATTVGGNGIGFYYFNGTQWMPITQMPTIDHDFYEVGTTVPPNSINDDIFKNGKVSIGEGSPSSINSKLTVMDSDNSLNMGLSVIRSHTNNTAFGHNGIYQQSFISGSGSYNGVYVPLQSISSSTTTGFVNNYSAVNNISRGNGISSNTLYYGAFNSNTGTSTFARSYGVQIDYSNNATSAGDKYGYFIDIDSSLPATHYGVFSEVLKATGYAGYFLGRMSIGTTTTNNYILPASRGTNGQMMQTDGAGNVSWVTPSTGTDDQNLTTPTLVGTTLNLNIENGTGTSIDLAPLQDGTGTDDQTIDNFSLTGTTLRLSLENDGQPLQTVNLAAINTDDQNLVTPTLVGTTLNLNIESGTGTSIDLAPLQDGTGTDDQIIDNFSLSGTTLRLSLENDGQPLQTVNLASLSGTDDQNLVTPTLVGTTLNLNIENGTGTSIDLAPLQDGTGTDDQTIDNFSLSGTTLRLSLENDGQPLQTVNLASLVGTDDQNLVTPTLVGTTLNLNIENGLGTSIDLAPLQDGTGTDDQTIDNFSLSGTTLRLSLENDGQPLQTVNLASINTDDQNLVTPTLVGTTLNLNIENGTGTSIDLAPLQDGTGTDDQTIDNFSLSGTTLRLSLENDGQPLQTVNLASLVGTDDQNLITPTLLGTTLNLNIENGLGTSIDLAPLQDGTGTDDQTIDNFSLSGTTLRLSLENDGQPLQTVNLASLVGTDDQNLVTPTLVGTTLNLNIENGLGTSIDLAPLQDGTGTDDQNIQNLAFNTTSNILTVGIENGTSQTVDLSILDTGGDVTAVTAGAGLTGGGITGAITINAAANNGLNVDATADAIQLGGPLTENTTITNGAFNMIFDVNTTGTFRVQDAGIDKFEMNTFGDGVFGGGTYWRNGSTATTDAILGRFIPSAGSGLFDVYGNGIINHTINGNGTTTFNNQGLDQDFIIESNIRNNMFYVDAGEDIVRIANTTGGLAQDGTIKVVNALNVTVDYIANFSDGGSGSTIGIGTAEFITDGGNQIAMVDSNWLPFNDNDDALGSSAYRWTSLWAVNGTINTSDINLKKNIRPLQYGLETLMDIETISYEWKNSQFNETKIGFSAQNLKSVIPEVVVDYDVVVTDEITNTKTQTPSDRLGVYYSDIIPVTVKAIQELKQKNDMLENRIKELEDKLNRLELIEAKLDQMNLK